MTAAEGCYERAGVLGEHAVPNADSIADYRAPAAQQEVHPDSRQIASSRDGDGQRGEDRGSGARTRPAALRERDA